MLDFVFLILHFNTYDDTIKCVGSIIKNKKYNKYQYKIIIVDNGSKNESYSKLKNIYANKENIVLIHSNENVGFANGNNLGLNYIKSQLKFRFVIMVNSDTIFNDSNFLENIEKNYEKYNFVVCGPDIVKIEENKHQNPKKINFKNIRQIKKTIKKFKFHLFLCNTYLEFVYLCVKRFLTKFRKSQKDDKYKMMTNKDIELHGACLIFSRKYFDYYDGLDKSTFLYFEESFLEYNCRIKNIDLYYFPNIHIIHNEQGSTKNSFNNIIKRKKFYYTNSLNSLNELLKLYKENRQ